MSEDGVRVAMSALANAELPGHPLSAEVLMRRADLRQRLAQAARNSPALEKGLPATLAVVCSIAAMMVTRAIAANGAPTIVAVGWAALAIFVSAAVATGSLVLRQR